MKISIVGANSFIARNFLVYLDRVTCGASEDVSLNLYDIHDEQIDGLSNYEKIDFLNKEDVKRINFDVDIIYVFAGKTGTKDGFTNPNLYVNVNEMVLVNLLSEYVTRENRHAKWIFPSSRLVYKGTGFNSDGSLISEPHKAVLLKETDELEAKTLYAANKISCEYYLNMYHNTYDVDYAVLRLCIPFGRLIEGSSYGTLGFMENQLASKGEISLYGTGSVKRTFTHMEDVCECFYKAGVCDNVINDIYNIGGEEFSLYDVASKLAEVRGGTVSFNPWPEMDLKIESGDTVFDGSKLEKAIGKTSYRKLEDEISF